MNMDLDFAELFAAQQQDVLPSRDFARNHVYAPLKRVVDALNNSETKLNAVDVFKTITVGQETVRVRCSLVTPLSLHRLESIGGMQKDIQENAPQNCTLTTIVYEPQERRFAWSVEFQFDAATRRRLLDADAAAGAAASAATRSGASTAPNVEAESLAMPPDSQQEKERLLRERRALEEASRIAEVTIRNDRTEKEIRRITSARSGGGSGGGGDDGGGGGGGKSLIRRTTTVAPAKQIVVKGKRSSASPAGSISKKGTHTKAKLDEEMPTLIRPAKPPSLLALPIPFLNKLLCFIGGVDSEGSNLADADYAKSHAYDTDLFVQTN